MREGAHWALLARHLDRSKPNSRHAAIAVHHQGLRITPTRRITPALRVTPARRITRGLRMTRAQRITPAQRAGRSDFAEFRERR